jgi:hypothetical protein
MTPQLKIVPIFVLNLLRIFIDHAFFIIILSFWRRSLWGSVTIHSFVAIFNFIVFSLLFLWFEMRLHERLSHYMHISSYLSSLISPPCGPWFLHGYVILYLNLLWALYSFFLFLSLPVCFLLPSVLFSFMVLRILTSYANSVPESLLCPCPFQKRPDFMHFCFVTFWYFLALYMSWRGRKWRWVVTSCHAASPHVHTNVYW